MVGLPDRTWGELVAAVVVPDAAGSVTEEVLGARCEAVMAGYKRPRRYLFVDALPGTAYGKALERELRERFTG